MERQNWLGRRTSVLEELSCLLWGSTLFGSTLTGYIKNEPLGKFSNADLCQLFTVLRDGTYLSANSHLQVAILKSLMSAMTVATYAHTRRIENSQSNQSNQIESWLKRRNAAVKEEIRLCYQEKFLVTTATENSFVSATATEIFQCSHRDRSSALQNLKQKIESALYVNTLCLKFRHDFKQDWLAFLSLFFAHRLTTNAKARESLIGITRTFTPNYSDEKIFRQAPGAVAQLIQLFAHPQTFLSLIQVIDFDHNLLRQQIHHSFNPSSADTQDDSLQTNISRSPADNNDQVDTVLSVLENSPRLAGINSTQPQNSLNRFNSSNLSNLSKTGDQTLETPPTNPQVPLPLSTTSKNKVPATNHSQTPFNWKCIHTLTGHSDSVVSVAYGAAKGQTDTLATGSWDKTIQIWEIHPGLAKPVPLRTLTAHSASVYSVAFSPDAQTLASGGVDCTIQLWHLGSMEHTRTGASLMRTLTGHRFPVYSVAFSPNGKLLASGSGDYTIKIWHFETGKLLSTLVGHSSFVYSVAFSPDGKTLASGSADKSIKIWQISNGQLLTTLISYSSVNCVAFSPDRQFLVSAGGDERIKLWQLSTNRLGSDTRPAPTQTLRGHTGEIFSLAFSPREPILASSSYDKTIKLWNILTGDLLATLTGHLHSVHSVAFSSDGISLVSVSHDKTTKIWQMISAHKKS